MKDLTISSREAHRQDHKEVPSKDGANKVRRRRRRRNNQDLPPSQDEANAYMPWLESIPERQYTNGEQRLHDEIVAYMGYMHPTVEEYRAHQLVLACIQDVVYRCLEGQVNLFGSCTTGLWLPTSDIDIAISTRSVTEQSKKSVLFHLASRLKSSGLTPFVRVNHHARVPILKLTTHPEYGSLNVDIGINNTDGIRGIEIINRYLAQMPALRPLILVVKGFLSRRSLNDASQSGLGSYAVTLMCISFLQMNPSKRAQELLDQPKETQSLGMLLDDFFLYYALEFPYTTSYISVTEGKVLPKASTDWIKLKDADRLVIQCVVNPEIDVAKSVSCIDTIRQVFKEAHAHILELTLLERNALGPLAAVNNQTLAHRARIAELFKSADATNLMVQPKALHYPRNVSQLPLVPPLRHRQWERRDHGYDSGRHPTSLPFRHSSDRYLSGGRDMSRLQPRPQRWESQWESRQ